MADHVNGNGAIRETLYRLNLGAQIDASLLREAFDNILVCDDAITRDVYLGQVLTGIMAKGPTIDEVTTLLHSALALDNFHNFQRKRVDLPPGEKLVSAIGSGKKGFKTMNISTPALIIAASAGAFTAKSVSKSTSSLTGSYDLMSRIGVNLHISTEDMIRTITTTGFGVFEIEHLIPKFDKVYGGRFHAPQALSFGLAALATPIEYDTFLYGLAHPNVELSLNVLQKFGVRNAMVAATTSDDIHYLDEMGVYGTTKIIGVRDGVVGKVVHFRPTEELGLPRYAPEDIAEGNCIEQNVQYAVDMLSGKASPAREDVACINAGTVLYLAGRAENLKDGYSRAKSVLRTGKPIEKIIEVIEATGGEKTKLERYL